MASSNSFPPALEESDDFLKQALGSTGPGRLETASKFAELDVQKAQDAVLIIAADDVAGRYSLSSEILAVLRSEIQTWLKVLRDQGDMAQQLQSSSARDQCVRQVAQKLLDVAYEAPSKSWMTMLPTGCQVIIAPSAVVHYVGFEGVCRAAHERAIRTAQANSQPYNTQALMHYQSARPMEMA